MDVNEHYTQTHIKVKELRFIFIFAVLFRSECK